MVRIKLWVSPESPIAFRTAWIFLVNVESETMRPPHAPACTFRAESTTGKTTPISVYVVPKPEQPGVVRMASLDPPQPEPFMRKVKVPETRLFKDVGYSEIPDCSFDIEHKGSKPLQVASVYIFSKN